MTIQEFNRRWLLIDGSVVVEISDDTRVQTLDDKTTKLVLRVLGLNKEPEPNRSFELAPPDGESHDNKPIVGVALQLLSLLSQHLDPIPAAQIQELGSFNPSTMSSKLSWLKTGGYVSAVGKPFQYMLTGKGQTALHDSAEPALDS